MLLEELFEVKNVSSSQKNYKRKMKKSGSDEWIDVNSEPMYYCDEFIDGVSIPMYSSENIDNDKLHLVLASATDAKQPTEHGIELDFTDVQKQHSIDYLNNSLKVPCKDFSIKAYPDKSNFVHLVDSDGRIGLAILNSNHLSLEVIN